MVAVVGVVVVVVLGEVIVVVPVVVVVVPSVRISDGRVSSLVDRGTWQVGTVCLTIAGDGPSRLQANSCAAYWQCRYCSPSLSLGLLGLSEETPHT